MKHAFLILAHTNFPQVCRLLKKLDHSDNTIYIHIDAKSSFTKEDEALLRDSCERSEVIMVDRYKVNWGGYSQINSELRILQRAVNDKHDYYHILSGVDFPIKSMDYMHSFFEKNAGCEFISISSEKFTKEQANRYKIYHFFQEKWARKNNLYSIIERGLLLIQRLLKVNRANKYRNIEFKCGSNWASITHSFATHLLSREAEIQKMFSYSLCCDEFFKQTIAYNSPFRNAIFHFKDRENNLSANLRCIDWERGDHRAGSPYTFNISDYELLINSPDLFCRKVTDLTPDGAALIEKLEAL